MDRNIPIDVIASCMASGQMQPLRFRMESEDGQLMRVNITEVISVREVAYVGIEAIIFLCQAEVEEKRHLFELRYTVRSHQWDLMRWVY